MSSPLATGLTVPTVPAPVTPQPTHAAPINLSTNNDALSPIASAIDSYYASQAYHQDKAFMDSRTTPDAKPDQNYARRAVRYTGLAAYVTADLSDTRAKQARDTFGRTSPYRQDPYTNMLVGRAICANAGCADRPDAFLKHLGKQALGIEPPAQATDKNTLYALIGSTFATKERNAYTKAIQDAQAKAKALEETRQRVLPRALMGAVTSARITPEESSVLQASGVSNESIAKIRTLVGLQGLPKVEGSRESDTSYRALDNLKLAGIEHAADWKVYSLFNREGLARATSIIGDDKVARAMYLELMRLEGRKYRDSIHSEDALHNAGLSATHFLGQVTSSIYEGLTSIPFEAALSSIAVFDDTQYATRFRALATDAKDAFQAGFAQREEEISANLGANWGWQISSFPALIAEPVATTVPYLNIYTSLVDVASQAYEEMGRAASNYIKHPEEGELGLWEGGVVPTIRGGIYGASIYVTGAAAHKLLGAVGSTAIGRAAASRITASPFSAYTARVTEGVITETAEEFFDAVGQETLEASGLVAERQKRANWDNFTQLLTDREFWGANVGMNLVFAAFGYKGSRSESPFADTLKHLGFSKKERKAIQKELTEAHKAGATSADLGDIVTSHINTKLAATEPSKAKELVNNLMATAQQKAAIQAAAANGVRDAIFKAFNVSDMKRNEDGTYRIKRLSRNADGQFEMVEENYTEDQINEWLASDVSRTVAKTILETQKLVRGEQVARAVDSAPSSPFSRVASLLNAPPELLAQLKGTKEFTEDTLITMAEYALNEINRRIAGGESEASARSAEFGTTGTTLGAVANVAKNFAERRTQAVLSGELKPHELAASTAFILPGRTPADNILMLARGDAEAHSIAHDWLESFGRSKYLTDPEHWREVLDALDADLLRNGIISKSLFANKEGSRTDLDYIETFTHLAEMNWLANHDSLALSDTAHGILDEVLADLGAVQGGLALAQELKSYLESDKAKAALGEGRYPLSYILQKAGASLTDILTEAEKQSPKSAADFILRHQEIIKQDTQAELDSIAQEADSPTPINTNTPKPEDEALPPDATDGTPVTVGQLSQLNGLDPATGTRPAPANATYSRVDPKKNGLSLIGGVAHGQPDGSILGSARLADIKLHPALGSKIDPSLIRTNPSENEVIVFRQKNGSLLAIGGLSFLTNATTNNTTNIPVRVYSSGKKFTPQWAAKVAMESKIRANLATTGDILSHLTKQSISRDAARRQNLIPKDPNGQELATSRAAWLLLKHATKTTINQTISGKLTTQQALDTIADKAASLIAESQQLHLPGLQIEDTFTPSDSTKAAPITNKDGTITTENAIIAPPTSSSSIKAMHASPHKFFKFSTDFMSSGEGSQAFGWGLYFAENINANKFYWDYFSSQRRLFHGDKEISENSLRELVHNTLMKHGGEELVKDMEHSFVRSILIDGAQRLLDDYVDFLKDNKEDIHGTLDAVRELASMNLEKKEIRKLPYNYRVELNVDDSNVLMWDRTYKTDDLGQDFDFAFTEFRKEFEQPISYLDLSYLANRDEMDWTMYDRYISVDSEEKLSIAKLTSILQKAITEATTYLQRELERKNDEWARIYHREKRALETMLNILHGQITGASLYDAITSKLGSPKAASMWLAERGFKGIKFLDRDSRRYGEGTYNYVIFDGKDIKITAYNESPEWSMDEGWQPYTDPTASFSVIGKKAKTWDKYKDRAFEGVDGHMRAELNDKDAKYTPIKKEGEYILGDILDYPELFDAYPQLKNIKVIVKGSWWATPHTDGSSYIQIYRSADFGVLLHEIQHVIQEIEGFASGGNRHIARRKLEDVIDISKSTAADVYVEVYDNLNKYIDALHRYQQRFEDIVNSGSDSENDQQIFDADLINSLEGLKEMREEIMPTAAYRFASDQLKPFYDQLWKSNFTSKLELLDYSFALKCLKDESEAILKAKEILEPLAKKAQDFQNSQEYQNEKKKFKKLLALGDISLYDLLGGEAESYNVERRLYWSDEQRASTPFNESLRGEDSLILDNIAPASFSIRKKSPPKHTGIAYKLFYQASDGKLYPPMVANPGGDDTPIGVWLDADEGERAEDSKTGRKKVKSGGKGTNSSKGELAYRPGWHMGEIPYALQFNVGDEVPNPLGIKNKKGQVINVRKYFPRNYVWAEVEYAKDVNYQEEAESHGRNKKGVLVHSLAGLPKLPTDGYYKYRTNPNPATDAWIISGAIKVNRILSKEEVDAIVRAAGREPQEIAPASFSIQAAKITPEMQAIKDAATKAGTFMLAPNGKKSNLNERQWLHVRTVAFKEWFGDWENDPANASKVVDKNGEPLVVYHGSRSFGFSKFREMGDSFVIGQFFSDSLNVAQSYSDENGVTRIDAKDDPNYSVEFTREFGGYKVGGNYAVFLNVRNPLVFDAKGRPYNNLRDEKGNRISTDELAGKGRNAGFDGIIVNKVQDAGAYANMQGDWIDSYTATDYISFNPNQIKSATDNSGTYDPSNADITFSIQAARQKRKYADLKLAQEIELFKVFRTQANKIYDETQKLMLNNSNNVLDRDVQAALRLKTLLQAVYTVLPKDAQPWKALDFAKKNIDALLWAVHHPHENIATKIAPGISPATLDAYNEMSWEDRRAWRTERISKLIVSIVESATRSIEAYGCRQLLESADEAAKLLLPKYQKSGKERRGVTSAAVYTRAQAYHDMFDWTDTRKAEELEAANLAIMSATTDAEYNAAQEHMLAINLYAGLRWKNLNDTQLGVEQFLAFIHTGREEWKAHLTEERRATEAIQEAIAKLSPELDISQTVARETDEHGTLKSITHGTLNPTQTLQVLAALPGEVGQIYARIRDNLANAQDNKTFAIQQARRDAEAALDNILGLTGKSTFKRDLARAKFLVDMKKRENTGITRQGRIKVTAFEITLEQLQELTAIRNTQGKEAMYQAMDAYRTGYSKQDKIEGTIPYEEAYQNALTQSKEETYQGGTIYVEHYGERDTHHVETLTLTRMQAANLVLLGYQPSYANKYDAEGKLIERGMLDTLGYTEDVLKALELWCGRDLMQYAFWKREYLNTTGLFEAYEQHMGLPFPKEENYWPGAFDTPSNDIGQDALSIASNGCGIYNMLIIRKKHLTEPNLTVDIESAWEHAIQQHYHYIHLSPITRQLRSITRDQDTNARLRKIAGNATLNNLATQVNALDGAPAQQLQASRAANKLFNNMFSAMAKALLNAASATTVKQISALGHALAHSSINIANLPIKLLKSLLSEITGAQNGHLTPSQIRKLKSFQVRINRESATLKASQLEADKTQGFGAIVDLIGSRYLEYSDYWANSIAMAAVYNTEYDIARKLMLDQNSGAPLTPEQEQQLRDHCETVVSYTLKDTAQPLEREDKPAFLQQQHFAQTQNAFMLGEVLSKVACATSIVKRELASAYGKDRSEVWKARGRAIYKSYMYLGGMSMASQSILATLALICGSAPDMDDDEFLSWSISQIIAGALLFGYVTPIPILGESIGGLGQTVFGQYGTFATYGSSGLGLTYQDAKDITNIFNSDKTPEERVYSGSNALRWSTALINLTLGGTRWGNWVAEVFNTANAVNNTSRPALQRAKNTAKKEAKEIKKSKKKSKKKKGTKTPPKSILIH